MLDEEKFDVDTDDYPIAELIHKNRSFVLSKQILIILGKVELGTITTCRSMP